MSSFSPERSIFAGLMNEAYLAWAFKMRRAFALPPTYLVFQTAGTPAPNDVPARIVRSNPPNAMQSVDSTRTMSITVTFDKPMNPKKHGLHLYENNQPIDISKLPFSYSADGMTFILPCN